jgi:hypothetical protein
MDTAQVKIEAQSVEAIARRVVELLRTEVQEQSTRLTDAATLARELGVERDWIYSHADELGAIRLGGPHGRLRFDRETVRERLDLDKMPQRRRRITRTRAVERREPKARPPGTRVKSPQKQRRASGRTPARSPRQHQPGGNPDDEA